MGDLLDWVDWDRPKTKPFFARHHGRPIHGWLKLDENGKPIYTGQHPLMGVWDDIEQPFKIAEKRTIKTGMLTVPRPKDLGQEVLCELVWEGSNLSSQLAYKTMERRESDPDTNEFLYGVADPKACNEIYTPKRGQQETFIHQAMRASFRKTVETRCLHVPSPRTLIPIRFSLAVQFADMIRKEGAWWN